MTDRSNVVVGFRPHTGWAAAVVVAAANDRPAVLDRQQITYEPSLGRFLYHLAAEMSTAKAERLVTTGREQAQHAAIEAIRELATILGLRSYTVVAAAIPTGNAKLPDSLADILAAHSRIHAAEGVFYRETLADACTALGLSVCRPPERDLVNLVSGHTGLGADQITLRIREMGKELGPPWSEDQKLATLAAWSCMPGPTESAPVRPGRKP